MRMARTVRGALAGGSLLAGCMPPVVQSALVETDEMSATYTIVTSPDGSRAASAQFWWGPGEADVLLDDGDRVLIDGIEVREEKDAVYSTRVQAIAEHVFVLERPAAAPIEHRGPPAASFAITSPPFTGTYDLEATLTWAPTRPRETVDIIARSNDVRCPTRTLADDRPDDGAFAFTGADVRPAGELPPACAFTLEVIRSAVEPGVASPLAGVTHVARHVATTTLSLR